MTAALRWGICATIKASTDVVLQFAAHHLDAGAHRVWIYLDEPNDEAKAALKAHPKCRVVECDDTYWRRNFGRRPKKHQVRQSRNATRTYSRAKDVDWLLQADADEFLVPNKSVQNDLANLAPNILTARVRPMEALASDYSKQRHIAFKRFIPPGAKRQETVRILYPNYGHCLRGGFLSHVAGKVFVRTGLADISIRIHNIFQGDVMNPASAELTQTVLAHLHAPNWETWRAHLQFRLEKGAYRAELSASRAGKEGAALHEVLVELKLDKGEAGLKKFFNEVVADSEALRTNLKEQGLLTVHDLQLATKRQIHFPRT